MSSVWESRWQTLETLLTALAKQYQHAAQTDPWMETMHSLIQHLKTYGEIQFHFYHQNLFQNKTAATTLTQPKEHVMHHTFNQITYDMALFQLAIGQRRQTNLQPTLCKADELAQRIFNLTAEHQLLKETHVVTYFGEFPQLRIVSYAPIALIAIPHKDITTTLFWQLIMSSIQTENYKIT